MSRKGSKVKRAFSREGLSRVCAMPEEEFAGAYGLETVQVSRDTSRSRLHRTGGDGDFYCFRDNGASVLAVAHLDTVVRPDERAARFFDTRRGTVVNSGGLDDRLGAYIVLDVLPRLGITYDVLLTTGEESGQSTAEFFEPQKDYDWMIEFDRGGTDVVMYQYEDDGTCKAVEASGAVVGPGIFSDISYMEHLGIKGFNWGVGYRDYHSTRSHAYLNETYAMVGRYRRFHQLHAGTAMPHVPEPEPAWYESYREGKVYGDDALRCWYCGEEAVDGLTGYCGECTACQDCGDFEDACDCWLPPRSRTAAAA